MDTCFELPSEVTIYNVAETRGAMLAWVSEHVSHSAQGVRVSARAVSEIDGAGLQLLAAFSNMGHRWHFLDASDTFTQACCTLGLEHWLTDNQAANT